MLKTLKRKKACITRKALPLQFLFGVEIYSGASDISKSAYHSEDCHRHPPNELACLEKALYPWSKQSYSSLPALKEKPKFTVIRKHCLEHGKRSILIRLQQVKGFLLYAKHDAIKWGREQVMEGERQNQKDLQTRRVLSYSINATITMVTAAILKIYIYLKKRSGFVSFYFSIDT